MKRTWKTKKFSILAAIMVFMLLFSAPVWATALSADKAMDYTGGKLLVLPVDDADTIYAGALVSVNAAGYVIAGADTASTIFVGIAQEYVDNSAGSDGDETVLIQRQGVFKMLLGTAISAANVGDNVFIADDATVDLTANVTHNIYVGIIAKYIDTTHAWVDITPAIQQADVATHIADASEAHAASAVSILDSGTFTSAAQVEAALAEIYQGLLTTKGVIQIPMPNITDAGVALAAFSNADDPLPGFCVTAEGLGIRWNNHGTPTAVATKVIIPPDADITANMTLHILAAKVGATEGDATKFTVVAYNNVVAALYDADADFGGDTDAMGGATATKTVQHVTLTLALANLTAYPAAMEITLQPKDGTLGTDDVILLAAWIEYKKKILTS